jgi:CrcB protein
MGSAGMLLATGGAGALGALARYLLAEWMARWARGPLPLATFLINVSGAFLLGLVLSLGGAQAADGAAFRTVLGVGFLGGYTTFSTWSYETDALARRGSHRHAWLNALGMLGAGMLAAALGLALGHAL